MESVAATFEQNSVSPTKNEYVHTLWNSNSTPKFIPNRNVGTFVPRDMHKNVHQSIIHNGLKHKKFKLV